MDYCVQVTWIKYEQQFIVFKFPEMCKITSWFLRCIKSSVEHSLELLFSRFLICRRYYVEKIHFFVSSFLICVSLDHFMFPETYMISMVVFINQIIYLPWSVIDLCPCAVKINNNNSWNWCAVIYCSSMSLTSEILNSTLIHL